MYLMLGKKRLIDLLNEHGSPESVALYLVGSWASPQEYHQELADVKKAIHMHKVRKLK